MLEVEKYYHIYNRANGFENLFANGGNYDYFKLKIIHHLLPILDVYSYCLMPNHFHILVKIKSKEEVIKAIKEKTPNYKSNRTFLKFETLEKFIPYFISKQFSNLFSSYTQAFNKQQNRTGSLFQKTFKRKEIDNLSYLQEVILYIHCNPTHHGFSDDFKSWAFSSYHEIISSHDTFLMKENVIAQFGTLENFKFCHQEKTEFHKINNYIIE